MIDQLARTLDFTRRSLSPENPGVPLFDAVGTLFDSGGPSEAGIPVNQEAASRLSAFWRGVKLHASTLASVPLCLYERQDPRGRRKATEHPLFSIVHDEWNPQMTSFFGREITQAQLVMQGNGYAYIRRDGAGRIRELWPLLSTRVDPRRYRDGEVTYQTMLGDGSVEPLAASEVLHVPGLSFDGIKGKSLLQAARDVIGSGIAVQNYGARFFRSGGRAPGVMKTQFPTIDKERLKNLAETWLSGRGDDWHKIAFLPKGMEYQAIGIPPNDAQWLESRKFTVTEMARILDLPPHVLYDLDRSTNNNIEHQGIELIIYSFRPYFVRWEQELNRKLLTAEERRRYYFEFSVEGLMRGDSAARGTFYSLGRQWGWLSANDVRELENRSDLGPAGDVYLTPINMANAEELVGGAAAPAALVARQVVHLLAERGGARALPEAQPGRMVRELAGRTGIRGVRLRRRIRNAHRGTIEDRAAVIVKREIGAVEKELKAQLGGGGRSRRSLPGLRQAIEEFYAEHAGWAGKKMHPVYRSYGELIAGAMADELGAGAGDDVTPELDEFIASYAKRFGIREASEGRQQLLALIPEEGDEEKIAAAVRGRLEDWGEKRAGKIADIEATRAMSAIVKTIYVAAGVTVLRWVANPGACAFCQAMDGKTAGVQQNFVGAGEGVDGGDGTDGPLRPSDDIGHPPLHDHCACDIVAD